ncbi:hypothetical protein MXMO3_01767 [Maritalea myrionectae]|uniref:Uncharacterized protein n=1 Tax=Maritalea myrionectae TaxID=454601 RepID=A0A2R4ME59_9HYPH|nr:hypothetical protein [Maritalea myrionectae]AVX04292.1 hypothetical protein MXMO3_01767 [Maritalea myrionectae]
MNDMAHQENTDQQDWTYWQKALAGDKPPVHEGDPQSGFYRRRLKKNGPFVPVAIWRDGDDWVALVDGKPADAMYLWTWVCDKPITKAEYDRVSNGEPWSDAPIFDPTATNDLRNSDPENELEALKDQIESAKAGIAEFEKIESDEAQVKAQALRARLNELSNEADKKRTAEKKPHLDAGKAVDAKWQPLVKDAKANAEKIKKAMSAYETEKLKKQREEQARLEQQRRETEEAAKRDEEMGRPKAADATPPPETDTTPEQTAPAPIKGNYGRAASVSVVKVVTGISDQGALYAFLKDHPELKQTMIDLAQRAVKKGFEVPGVSIDEQAKVS